MSNIDAFANSFEPEMPGVPRVGEPTDGTFPTDAELPETEGDGPPDAEERIAEHLAERGGDDAEAIADVPAGGAGADSGGGSAVRVDPASTSEVKDESVHDDEPGVGTRHPSR